MIPHGYDLLGALAISHALLEATNRHAVGADCEGAQSIDAAYLAAVQAPFDWEEAQRRVGATGQPGN